jgi:hypothetical protein
MTRIFFIIITKDQSSIQSFEETNLNLNIYTHGTELLPCKLYLYMCNNFRRFKNLILEIVRNHN